MPAKPTRFETHAPIFQAGEEYTRDALKSALVEIFDALDKADTALARGTLTIDFHRGCNVTWEDTTPTVDVDPFHAAARSKT